MTFPGADTVNLSAMAWPGNINEKRIYPGFGLSAERDLFHFTFYLDVSVYRLIVVLLFWLAFPLLWGECFLWEGVNGFQFVSNGCIYQTMTLNKWFAGKLFGYHNDTEFTTTAVWLVNYFLECNNKKILPFLFIFVRLRHQIYCLENISSEKIILFFVFSNNNLFNCSFNVTLSFCYSKSLWLLIVDDLPSILIWLRCRPIADN